MPPVDYKPLSATEQRQRWPAAVAHLFDWRGLEKAELIDRTGRDRPGLREECVFDFHDGLRWIVSTETHDFWQGVHLSASARPDSALWRKIRSGGLKPDAFVTLIVERVRFVSGLEMCLIGFTSTGIPHFTSPAVGDGAQARLEELGWLTPQV